MTTPTPPLFGANELSVCIVHHSALSVRLSLSRKVNFVMKFAKACALMAVLGWYSMSNWLSSIVHWIILSATSGLFMDFLIG